MTQQTPKLANLFRLEFPQSVGSFATYEDAQKAVDHLADAHFPVENLAIVGTDLRSIERVLGRRTWATVIGQGVQSGLSTGLLVAFLMWILQPGANFLVLIVSALVIGFLWLISRNAPSAGTDPAFAPPAAVPTAEPDSTP